jgi:membrane glycosyltransferase
MDARVSLNPPAAHAPAFLPEAPPEAPLAMPQQPLSDERRPVFGETDGRWRILCVVLPALAMTALALRQSHSLMSVDGVTGLEWLVLGLFALNFAWVSAAACTAIIGALVLFTREKPTASAQFKTTSRTAIVFPICNETPEHVMGGASAVAEALEKAGVSHAFEFFFLSDTRDADLARAEQTAFGRLRLVRPDMAFFYRRRASNHGRKAGNVAEFVRRWGGRYDYMVVFDADSLMTAGALTQLVERMDTSPGTALIQTLPVIVNAQTVFARTQQFAMRAYGQLFGAGLSWWSGGAGNFWGHNAIIRMQAFAAHAGLPDLPGEGPLGGHIMSHDFVEAGLLRRAGWRVEIAHDIEGSYEECPPTLLDMAARDRRWARGNIQHIALLGARGFDPVSRFHMLAGVMGYLSAPLWFALIAAGLALSWTAAGDTEAAHAATIPGRLAAITAMIVLAPKWLAFLLWTVNRLPGWSRSPRFLASLALEAVVSALIAPIMMVSQTFAVISALSGADVGWNAQTRTRSGLSFEEVIGPFAPHLIFGLAICIAVIGSDPALIVWAAPVFASLVLAAPISLVLSRAVIPRTWLWRLTSTPEDARPPQVVRAARRASARFGARPALPAPAPEPLHFPTPALVAPPAEASQPGVS